MLTNTQKVSVAEITQETYATIDSLLSSLNFNAEQEAWIIDRIVLWNEDRDDIDVELEGGSSGVKFKVSPVLDSIRKAMRKMFGLSLYSTDIQEGSYALCNRVVW